MKVLIVDDAELMRNLLKTILKQDGFEICGEADNGSDGLEKYKELNPDLVFLDIVMQKMNGIECLSQIKQLNPAVKVIMCSAMGQESYVTEALAGGADEFVVKPFKAKDVLKTVHKVVG